jgi:glycyl-tRNA synthetase (class II)
MRGLVAAFQSDLCSSLCARGPMQVDMTSPNRTTMTRAELMKQLAEIATRPLVQEKHPPVCETPSAGSERVLYVWFEDTSTRTHDGRRGIAGLPESLLPFTPGLRVLERRFAEGHMHLLCAVRLKCQGDAADRIAALYTAALSVGTVAWIGTGAQYERTWTEMYGTRPLLPHTKAN